MGEQAIHSGRDNMDGDRTVRNNMVYVLGREAWSC